MRQASDRHAFSLGRIAGRGLAWVVLGLLLHLGGARAAPFEVTSDAGSIALRAHVRALFETGEALDPETVARRHESGKPHPLSPPNYGRFRRPAWGYVSVVNRLARREWILTYSLSTVEDVRVFVRHQGEASFTQLDELGAHARLPLTGHRAATFTLALEKDRPVEIVTRLATRAPIGFHLQLWAPEQFLEADRGLVGLAAISTAIPLAVLLYLAILSTILRHHGLVSLMVLLASKLVIDAWTSGLGWLVLPMVPRPAWPFIGFGADGVFAIACVLHLREFLDLRRTPWIDRVVIVTGGLGFVLAAIEVSELLNVRYLIQLHKVVAFAVFAAAAVLRTWQRPALESICYALAWAIFMSEAMIQFLRLIIQVPFYLHSLAYGQSAIGALLFGVAVFTRMRDRDQQLNRSLAETNERFRLAIEGSAAAIYEYSFRDRHFSFAPRLVDVLPLPAGGRIRSVIRSLPAPTRAKLLGSLRETLANGGRHFRVEITREAEAGMPRVLGVTGAIQYDDEGRPRRICGSVIDMTSEANLRIEQTLRSMVLDEKERVERSLRARTNFYAAANHDLRHPLLSLGLYLEMLASGPTLARLKEFQPRMLEAHRAALSFLERIVALARSDIRLDLATRKREALDPILSRIVDRYQADAGKKRLDLRYVRTSLAVDTDAFLLERIVSNLVSNAIQNTSTGRILIGCRRANGSARIDVIDTGPGLPRAICDQLTGARQPDPAKVAGSLRLGLTIVRRTADELGCRISVDTPPRRGSRLSVHFDNAAAA